MGHPDQSITKTYILKTTEYKNSCFCGGEEKRQGEGRVEGGEEVCCLSSYVVAAVLFCVVGCCFVLRFFLLLLV